MKVLPPLGQKNREQMQEYLAKHNLSANHVVPISCIMAHIASICFCWAWRPLDPGDGNLHWNLHPDQCRT